LTGRSAEALALYERHNESNPLNPINEVWTLFYAGNYPAAIAAADMEIKIDPNAWFYRSIRSNCLALMNRCAEALSESDAILSDMPAVRSDASTLIQLGGNYALCGDRKKAREMLDALLKTDSSREDPSWLAWIYAPLGEKELALSALEKGYELHSNGMVYIKVDPFFDSLRDDPRFKALLKKVGFEK
jgi:tetratricopeptide (TPR) repeat protein